LCLFVCLFVSKEALHIWWTISHRQGNGMGTHDLGGMRNSATAWELVCFLSLFFFFFIALFRTSQSKSER
jgi:hypothetical protein